MTGRLPTVLFSELEIKTGNFPSVPTFPSPAGDPYGEPRRPESVIPDAPPIPAPYPIPQEFAAFIKCANGIDLGHCNLPTMPKGGNPFKPPTGAKGDMGVTPNEGSVGIPDFGDPLSKVCNCFKQHPLAAFDPRFTNYQLGSTPGACLAPVFDF